MINKQTIQENISAIKSEWAVLGQNKIIRWSTFGVGICVVVSLILFLISLPKLPPLVPLWFSRPWSTDRLASPWWLLLLPGSSFAIFSVNRILSATLTKHHLVFCQILLITSFLTALLSLWTLTMIIWIIL